MHYRTLAATVMFLTGIAATTSGQQLPLNLQFQNGTVSLKAQNVAVRQILAEWARVGGTRIIDGDRVGGGPVSLELTDVPEQQALDIVLRGVAGYMLAPRASTSTGISVFDRILILPSSTAPRAQAPATAAFGANGVRPGMPAPSLPPRAGSSVEAAPVAGPADADEDDDDGDDDEEGDTVTPGVIATPAVRPPMPAALTPRPVPTPSAPVGGIPPMIQFPAEHDAETPAKPGPAAGNPFGAPAGSSSLPGVISPAPPQQPSNPR